MTSQLIEKLNKEAKEMDSDVEMVPNAAKPAGAPAWAPPRAPFGVRDFNAGAVPHAPFEFGLGKS